MFYVDKEYIYYSAPGNRDNVYAYNKTTGVRSTIETDTTASPSWRTNIGLYSVTNSSFYQFISGKRYTLSITNCSFYANTSDGKIALVCASQSYSSAVDYIILMKDSEGFYKQIVYFTRGIKGFPIALLDTEDGVNYPLICSDGSNIITYNINTLTNALDLVGKVVNSSFSSSYHYDYVHNSASIGDITFRMGRSGSNFSYFNVFRTVKDSSGVYSVEMLPDLRQQVIDYIVLQGGNDYIENLCFVGNVLSLYVDSVSAQSGYYFLKVDTDKLTVTGYDFAPNITNKKHKVLFNNGYGLTFDGMEGNKQKYTQSFMRPIEQKYTASPAQSLSFFANQTLTGIVKENNNGVLKVSTVEDPNNPPPAIPDEAGLRATINYGGDVSINPNLVITSGITKSGTNLSGFTNSSSYKVTSDSPFTSLSSMSSFDIVMCATHPADGGYYHWLAGLTDSANAYRGFDIRTQGSDFLEANIYHEDGTSTYLISGTTLPTNTKTFIKLSYNSSSGYTLSFSPDGVSYTQVATSATTKPMDTTAPTLFLGWRPQKQQSTYYWNGTIHLADCYFNVNGTKIWSGTKVNFGSVGVGYGYFKNDYFYPLGGNASKDKYVPYDGGWLTEDNISGRKASTMNIILARNADMGSWTSDTKGFLSAQDSVVLGVNKKLPTPVYLWHDLSYISPAVPETLEPDVTTGGSDYVVVGSPVISSGIASGFSADNYITASTAVGSTNNATYKARFRVDAIGLKGPIMHYEGLFGLNIDESGNLYDWNWSNSAAVNICATTAGHTYTASVNINGTTRSWTVTDETTGETFTNSLTDSRTNADSSITLTYGRSSSTTATTYFNGSIYLEGCSVIVGDTVVWAAITAGTVSLPASWKTLDGVVYEYPNGFPKTQASAITVKYPRLNVDVIGSPAVSSLSGDVSGFTTSDFLRVPYKYWKEDLSTPGSGFDIDIAFSVDAQGNPGQYVLGGSTLTAPITLGFTSAGNMEVDVYCTAETTKTFRMSYAGAIEVGNRYVFRIGYNTFSGYYVTRSTNNGEPETLVTNSATTPPYMYSVSELWLGRAAYDLIATGLVVHLPECAIYVNGEKKWEGLDPDTTIGEPALYATKTGDSCSFAISTKAPKGVDSSAVIGTVELDANGAITSYSPSGKVIFNGIDVTEHVTEVEVYVGSTRYTISEIPYSVLSEKGILGESGFYTVTKVKPKTGYFFAGDVSYSATSVSLNYVPGFKVLQFGTFKDGQYSTFTGELTFKKVEGYMPAA